MSNLRRHFYLDNPFYNHERIEKELQKISREFLTLLQKEGISSFDIDQEISTKWLPFLESVGGILDIDDIEHRLKSDYLTLVCTIRNILLESQNFIKSSEIERFDQIYNLVEGQEV